MRRGESLVGGNRRGWESFDGKWDESWDESRGWSVPEEETAQNVRERRDQKSWIMVCEKRMDRVGLAEGCACVNVCLVVMRRKKKLMGEKGRSEIEGDKDETKWDRLAWDNEGDGSSGRCRRRKEKRERRKERRIWKRWGEWCGLYTKKRPRGGHSFWERKRAKGNRTLQ